MKKLLSKGLFIIGVSLISLSPVFAENQPDGAAGTPDNSVQDTARASQYFEDELSFKTNLHFINRVIKNKLPNITIVDVRSTNDFAKGHIPGAINLPYDKFNSFDGSEAEFGGLRKDGFNCIYCYTKTCNLSQKAAKKFASLGYPVKEIVGGYELWTEGNNPIETDDGK